MRKLIYAAGMVAILAAAFVVVQRAAPQSNQPKIIWSSSSVYAGIAPTTTIAKTLTFTSDQPLSGVVVEAVPQIAGFVQIQPSTFSQVLAGQPQTVRLIFGAPAGAQFGAYDATIHVRVGSSTLPQTLKASVTFAVVPLPPDPGDAGNTTLAGVDSNANGVRDDVERSIGLMNVPAQQIPLLFNIARTMQQSIVSAPTKDGAIQLIKNELVENRCLFFLMGDQARVISKSIAAAMLKGVGDQWNVMESSPLRS